MKKTESKILFLGLQNSGKTSIIFSLQKKTNLLTYFSLKPTKGIEISEFEDSNTNFIVWDFGGQKEYRDEYLTKFNEYIEKTSKIFYIIDVQDNLQHATSLKYLKRILTILKKESLNPEFSIFLHKFDPDFKPNETLINNLIEEIKSIVPQNFEINIFKTTIFTVFRKTSII